MLYTAYLFFSHTFPQRSILIPQLSSPLLFQFSLFIIIILKLPSILNTEQTYRQHPQEMTSTNLDLSRNKIFSYSSAKNLQLKTEPQNYTSRQNKRRLTNNSMSSSRVSFFLPEKQNLKTQRNQFPMVESWYPFTKNKIQKALHNQREKQQTKSSYPKPPSTKYGSETSSFYNLKPILNANDIYWRKQNGDMKTVTKNDSMKVLSNNFLSSFRVVFNQLMETFFLQIYLKKKIRFLTSEIWNHIIKSAGSTFPDKNQTISSHPNVDIKVVYNALKNVFPNEFKSSQIQQAIKLYFPSKNQISYKDFQSLMTFGKENLDHLVEISFQRKYGSVSPTKVINPFLRTLIQYADFEKKLRMISKANQNQFITLLINMSKDQLIQVHKFASFLDNNQNSLPYALRETQTKLSNFFGIKFGQKCSKFQFSKWMKNQKALLK